MSTQSVKIWLDKNLVQSTKGCGELLTCLEKLPSTSAIIEALPVENSIQWTRGVATGEIQHDHVLVKMDTDLFADHLQDAMRCSVSSSSSLTNFVRSVKRKANVTRVTLLVPGFKQFLKSLQYRKSDAKARTDYDASVGKKASKSLQVAAALTRSDVNASLIELELTESACVRWCDSGDELRDIVLAYTKSVADYESKCGSSADALLIFCDKTADKSQAKVGKDGQGALNLWKDMLEAFMLVSSDQAQAICAVYPSPLLLKRAFENAASVNARSAPLLLADIQVRRGAGVLTSVRKIGPELSQKIYKFFNAVNCNELLVNE